MSTLLMGSRWRPSRRSWSLVLAVTVLAACGSGEKPDGDTQEFGTTENSSEDQSTVDGSTEDGSAEDESTQGELTVDESTEEVGSTVPTTSVASGAVTVLPTAVTTAAPSVPVTTAAPTVPVTTAAPTVPVTTAAPTVPVTTVGPAKRSQQIEWPTISSWRFGDSQVVDVVATSDLPVDITGASGSCSVESAILGTVRATDVGPCRVSAVQAGSTSWKRVESETTYSISRAQAELTSFRDFYRYSGVRGCEINPGPDCPVSRLSAETTGDVTVTFALAPGANEVCRVDGDRFWLTNFAALLPRECPIDITASASDRYLGFEARRTVSMNPFQVTLEVWTETVAGGYNVWVSTNDRGWATSDSCGAGGPFDAASSPKSMFVDSAGANEGCEIRLLAGGGDAARTTECRRVAFPNGTVASCG